MPSTQAATTTKPRSFVTLDALRGVAALPVVWFHIGGLYHGRMPFQHAYLAVDFFFLLSGFVMAYVYQDRLDSGWTSFEFLRARLLRLYPLYILGTLIGACWFLVHVRFGKQILPLRETLQILALGVLFLPVPPLPFLPRLPDELYRFDYSAWSLFFELFANFIHAVFLRRRSSLVLILIVVTAGLFLLHLQHVAHGLDRGSARTGYAGGFERVLFSYPLGILMYRVWTELKLTFPFAPILAAVILFASFAIPTAQRFSGVYDFLAISVLFPLLLLVGASNQPAPLLVRGSQLLGAISYPLYILHLPIARYTESFWTYVTKHPASQHGPLYGIFFLLLVVPLSYWVGDTFDPEVRKLIHTHLIGRWRAAR